MADTIFLGAILLTLIGIAFLLRAVLKQVRSIAVLTEQDFWERAYERDWSHAAADKPLPSCPEPDHGHSSPVMNGRMGRAAPKVTGTVAANVTGTTI